MHVLIHASYFQHLVYVRFNIESLKHRKKTCDLLKDFNGIKLIIFVFFSQLFFKLRKCNKGSTML